MPRRALTCLLFLGLVAGCSTGGGSGRATSATTTRPAAASSTASSTGSTTAGPPATVPGTPGCTAPAGTNRGSEVRFLAAGGTAHTYHVSAPAVGPGSTKPAPLIVLLHGFASSGEDFARLTRMPAKGTAAGFVVAVPDGGGKWDIGDSDDDRYLQALIGVIGRTFCLDPHRTYLAGFSLGAAFAITYTCRHQSQITALVTVAVDFQLGCTRPVPYLAFHGTVDPLVPYQNGVVGQSLPGLGVRGTQLNMTDWAKLDRCRPTAIRDRAGPHVVRQRWRGCAPGTDVTLYTVEGGTHAWPGADNRQSNVKATQEVDATALAVAFFGTHPHA